MATLAVCFRNLAVNTFKTCAFRAQWQNVSAQQTRRSFCRISTTLLSEKKFSRDHEWVTVEGNIGTIGISDHAQDSLGDIVYCQLPDVGEEFDKDDSVAVLESVKAASDIYTPVSGVITAKNTTVEENPETINSSPYEEGWLYKMELTKAYEVDELMTEEAYQAFLKEEVQGE